jgi:hypothetical protein
MFDESSNAFRLERLVAVSMFVRSWLHNGSPQRFVYGVITASAIENRMGLTRRSGARSTGTQAVNLPWPSSGSGCGSHLGSFEEMGGKIVGGRRGE